MVRIPRSWHRVATLAALSLFPAGSSAYSGTATPDCYSVDAVCREGPELGNPLKFAHPPFVIRRIGRHSVIVPRAARDTPIYQLYGPELSLKAGSNDPNDVVTVFLHVLPAPAPGFADWRVRLGQHERSTREPIFRSELGLYEYASKSAPERPFVYLHTRKSPSGTDGTLIDCGGPAWTSAFGGDNQCTVYLKIKNDVYVRYWFRHRWIGHWRSMHENVRSFANALFIE